LADTPPPYPHASDFQGEETCRGTNPGLASPSVERRLRGLRQAALHVEGLLRGRTDSGSPRPFLSPLHFKLDGLTLLQAVEIQLLKATAMEEDLLTICGSNETESTITDNSLNCPLHSHLG